MKAILMGFVLLVSSSPALAEATWNCKASSYYDCDPYARTCSQEDTLSVEFTLTRDSATVAMYSLVATDSAPVLSVQTSNGRKSVDFLVNAAGRSVSGEKMEISAQGRIGSDKTFNVLIDGVHYQGTCQ